ncbi:MAG: hypothetical protein A3G32_06155 [Deltaproteobacteria bacterium RIFCSPLOWO2_12_FULL_40_28]|nr:MAG: hypothetical protein A3C45_02250 [Deltaproteobacteria bacterium RIFCSPHIGHO2_02_FULL_40_28]OGQ19037.1 MAG: hypothetical protein A3E27_05340 [Deltaproteobacteria bacterium RIFCSPHIGHO2_12_FULL_40_32]OGQ40209.1 MAG: hypothetical protein A3I69_00780 [Deltaproteobacteria bacterium RIFCSPLOWO2_02_FULL_40_36]OGQ53480.1 MAG: hypothetical protein A3G32_06155 [Deltaproteobacteria bacterium RIFCSPLOWO2_12_FULL_40_28]
MKERFQLNKAQGFQWDYGNSKKNLHKHQVSCEEAEQIFFNRPLLFIEDLFHSQTELRMKAFGRSNTNRLLIVSFTMRGEFIRVISARPMNKKEREIYEKQN